MEERFSIPKLPSRKSTSSRATSSSSNNNFYLTSRASSQSKTTQSSANTPTSSAPSSRVNILDDNNDYLFSITENRVREVVFFIIMELFNFINIDYLLIIFMKFYFLK